jgi:hypothetical protein
VAFYEHSNNRSSSVKAGTSWVVRDPSEGLHFNSRSMVNMLVIVLFKTLNRIGQLIEEAGHLLAASNTALDFSL